MPSHSRSSSLGSHSGVAVAMTGAVVLVTDFLAGDGAAALSGGLLLLLFAGIWYALPIGDRGGG